MHSNESACRKSGCLGLEEVGCIMEDSTGDTDLKKLLHRRLNIIDGSISSYCSILNSPERLHMIKQANEMTSVLCDIKSDRVGEEDNIKKRAI